MPPPPEAVIFDLDGCLVDSENLAIGAITDELRDMGVANVAFEDIRARFLGVSMRVICDHVAQSTNEVDHDEFVRNVETRLFRRYRQELQQTRGVTEMLAALRQNGVAMAIATGGSIQRMTQTLAYAGLSDWFAGRAFSADQVERGKPAPDLFELSARKLGVSPDKCVVLEDSPHGIQGGIAAGMRAIGFVGGSHLEDIRDAHTQFLLSKGAQAVATDMQEVTDLILGPLGSAVSGTGGTG